MPNKLVNMAIREVSVVDAASNGRKFLIMKRNYSEDERKEMATRGEAMPDGSFPIKTAQDVENAVHEWGRGGAKSSVKEHIMRRAKELGAMDNIPDGWKGGEKVNKSVVERIIDFAKGLINEQEPESLEFDEFAKSADTFIKAGKKISGKRMDALKDVHQKLGALIEGAVDNDDEGDDNVAKGNFPEGHPEGCMCEKCAGLRKEDVNKSATPPAIPEEFQKRMDAIEKQNLELKEQIAKTANETATKQFIQKAASYNYLGINAEELGPVLKSIADTNPEGFAKMEATLRAANEQVAKGKLFAEVGRDGVVDSDITKRAEGMAIEIQKRDHCTIEKARTQVWRENPEMYREYLNEMGV